MTYFHIKLTASLHPSSAVESIPSSTADDKVTLLRRREDSTGPNRVQTEHNDSLLLLSTYDPARNPVIKESLDSLQLPIKTGIVSISPLIGEAMHFIYDGVVRSSVLSLVGVVSLYGENTTDAVTIIPKYSTIQFRPQDADLWIVDGARVAKLKRSFLDQIIHTSDPSWKVLFIDFSDQFPFQLRNYHKLNLWNRPHVRLAVRSIVQGRHYDAETNHIIPGRIAPNRPTTGGPMLHAPYAVRTDIMNTIHHVLRVSNTTNVSATETALANVIFDPNRHRPIDVLHLWNISFREGKSKLRNSVSKLIRSWNGTLLVEQNRKLTTSIHEQGERRQVGRNMVDAAYVRALLTSKIVVVTQKDDWEDHYRLFESMSCGALILHDSMIAPPKGLVDGQSIIFFRSLQDLEERALYYLMHDQERLAVARQGWEWSMRRHRSWHRIEELVFGRPLTNHVDRTNTI